VRPWIKNWMRASHHIEKIPGSEAIIEFLCAATAGGWLQQALPGQGECCLGF
jgi:hypothetical protein